MQVILFGTQDDYDDLVSCIGILPELQYRTLRCVRMEQYDDFVIALRSHEYDLIMVFANGAAGMEGVIAAKSLCPDTAGNPTRIGRYWRRHL